MIFPVCAATAVDAPRCPVRRRSRWLNRHDVARSIPDCFRRQIGDSSFDRDNGRDIHGRSARISGGMG